MNKETCFKIAERPVHTVDAMAELIEMAPGTRPARTCLGVDFGVRDRNQAIDPFDAGLLDAMGMTAFITLAVGAGEQDAPRAPSAEK